MKIINLIQYPNKIEEAANWFSKKWNIPYDVYIESMKLSFKNQIPKWYVIYDKDKIVAGCGIIANDFHDRKDLTPNLCALYVEKEYRGKGYARYLLSHACQEAKIMGYTHLYLVTDHTAFYEKCGWSFLTEVLDENNKSSRMYVIEL